ncbi:hypothetical protein HY643_04990 [Candidatus Woesearchaeota archaeon]|nr:hypothetical protein [Candidatus Woesearchaeota archaeon]
MKKFFVFLISLVLLAVSVSAADLQISHEEIVGAVQAGGIATFRLTITNLGINSDTFQIVPSPLALDPSSEFEYIISSPSQVFVPGKGSATVNVSVKTKEKIAHGRYYETEIIVRSVNDANRQQNYPLSIHILAPDEIVRLTPLVTGRVKPGEDFTIGVKLDNMVNQPLHGINFYVSSDIFEEKRVLEFLPFQERTETLTFHIPSSTKSQDYKLSIRAYQGEWLNAKKEVSFKVLVSSDIKDEVEVVKGFLYTKTVITKTNVGNSITEDRYSTKVQFIKKLFTSFTVDPAQKNGELYSWVFSINPEAKQVLVIKTDYRPVFWAIIVILLSALTAYYWISRSVVVKKQVFKLKQTQDGLIELKILLHIINRSSNTIRNVTLTELLPAMIHPTAKFGTLKPNKMQQGVMGMRLMWEMPELVKGEERVFSYEVTSKMGIVGKFMLPAALLRYKTARNRTVNIKSNRLTLLPGFEQ